VVVVVVLQRARAMGKQEEKEGLDNLYIESVLSKFASPDFFAGVFSSDTLPDRLCSSSNFALVCNLSAASQPGSHFVVIAADAAHVLYLDPLGLPFLDGLGGLLSSPGMERFLRRCCSSSRHRTLLSNRRPLQDARSNYCGFYAILLVLLLDPATSLSSSSSNRRLQFATAADNLLSNDAKCLQYISQLIASAHCKDKQTGKK
jgi:hypothetical protein